jgi:hypothetical protein
LSRIWHFNDVHCAVDDLDAADSTRFLAFDPNPALFGPSAPIAKLPMVLRL